MKKQQQQQAALLLLRNGKLAAATNHKLKTNRLKNDMVSLDYKNAHLMPVALTAKSFNANATPSNKIITQAPEQQVPTLPYLPTPTARNVSTARVLAVQTAREPPPKTAGMRELPSHVLAEIGLSPRAHAHAYTNSKVLHASHRRMNNYLDAPRQRQPLSFTRLMTTNHAAENQRRRTAMHPPKTAAAATRSAASPDAANNEEGAPAASLFLYVEGNSTPRASVRYASTAAPSTRRPKPPPTAMTAAARRRNVFLTDMVHRDPSLQIPKMKKKKKTSPDVLTVEHAAETTPRQHGQPVGVSLGAWDVANLDGWATDIGTIDNNFNNHVFETKFMSFM